MPHEVIMPMLGMAQETGLIVSWLKRVGDPVKAGEPLMEVETDKTTMEVEAARDGFLVAIRVEAGVEVPVGQVVGVISETADAVDTAPSVPAAASAVGQTETASAAPAAARSILTTTPGKVLASPKAKALARARGIDLAALARNGRPVHAADVEAAAAPPAPVRPGLEPIASPSTRRLARQLGVDLPALAAARGDPEISRAALQASAGPVPSDPWAIDHAQFGPVEAQEVSRFNRVAAKNLAAAQATIPAVTHHDRADITALEALRTDLAPEAEARGVRLTALAFHVRALAQALLAFPTFNASLSSDGRTLWVKRHVAIGIAVDTPHGLMVPVLRDADHKDLWQIATELAGLAERARSRKLRPEDSGGAGMSITNLGGIGGIGFTPIVNPPEMAILGLSRASIEPVWDGEVFRPRLMLPLDLSYDHRVINGAEAARFVVAYAGLLAAPRELVSTV
jgi:pyruvate dehydrogenase E2 component (dihydrolipoamide acetyltransferase)